VAVDKESEGEAHTTAKKNRRCGKNAEKSKFNGAYLKIAATESKTNATEPGEDLPTDRQGAAARGIEGAKDQRR
jgi:hypothetical protein